MRNIQQVFVLCTASQMIGGDFAKFCGLLRIYELYLGLIVWPKAFWDRPENFLDQYMDRAKD